MQIAISQKINKKIRQIFQLELSLLLKYILDVIISVTIVSKGETSRGKT